MTTPALPQPTPGAASICRRLQGCLGDDWCHYCGARLTPTAGQARSTVALLAARMMRRSRPAAEVSAL